MRYPLLLIAVLVLSMYWPGSTALGKPQGQEGEDQHPDIHSSATEFVNQLDTDGDHRISLKEYLDATKVWFNRWDLNGDGYITVDEIEKVIELHEQVRKGGNNGK